MINFFGPEEAAAPPEPQFSIEWVDSGKTAKNPPDPKFPGGVTLADPSLKAGDEACGIDLPYPAKGIGAWKLKCNKCGRSVACTAAGRPDDPRHMIVKCKSTNQQT